MTNPERYPYQNVRDAAGQTLPRPLLPIRLGNQGQALELQGLLDTGASVNVLPYNAGLELGLIWNDQSQQVHLTGNLAQYPAQGIILTAHIGYFEPVSLIFAWTRALHVPLLLGQVNFLAEFDVCFFYTQRMFEIRVKASA
jgi:hypothetical protein